jgi:hypothetical protein
LAEGYEELHKGASRKEKLPCYLHADYIIGKLMGKFRKKVGIC